jgi:hypothetical protein
MPPLLINRHQALWFRILPIWQQLWARDRNIPRTCTPENAVEAITVDNQVTFVANLAIDAETKQPNFSNSVLIDSYLTDPDRVKEAMQQLMDMILGFFEVEIQKVESGVLKEEEMLLDSYVQELDTDTKRPVFLPPKSPYQRGA